MKTDSEIKLSTTVPAKGVAGALFDLGIDSLIIGNNEYGLRLPTDYDLSEISQLVIESHSRGKEIIVAANAILHNEILPSYRNYLSGLNDLGIDYVMVGDAGAVNIIQENFPNLKFIYNGEVLDTNSSMINFWGAEGASYVRIARELPYVELKELLPKLTVRPIFQLFGPIAIQHSARSLIYNYLDYEEKTEEFELNKIYHVTLPKHPTDVYSMFEDKNGTHMYGPDDLNLLGQFPEMVNLGISDFTFDSKFYNAEDWLKIMDIFVQARNLLNQQDLKQDKIKDLEKKLASILPVDRKYSTGFYHYEIGDIK